MSRRIETNDLIGIQQQETWDHQPADLLEQGHNKAYLPHPEMVAQTAAIVEPIQGTSFG